MGTYRHTRARAPEGPRRASVGGRRGRGSTPTSRVVLVLVARLARWLLAFLVPTTKEPTVQIRVFHHDFPDYDERMALIALGVSIWLDLMEHGACDLALVPRETD